MFSKFKSLSLGVFFNVVFIFGNHVQSAFALDSLSAADLSGFSQDSVKSLAKTVAIGADMHAYHPATPLGTSVGLDLGIDVTAVKLSAEVLTALSLATGKEVSTLPSLIPLPRFVLHKGLPWGLDLGVHYARVAVASTEVFKTYGGEINWAYLRQPGKLAASLRLSGTVSKVYFITGSCYDLDALVSYPVVTKFIEPYLGAGFQLWQGKLEIPIDIPQLPATISASDSGLSPHFYAGMMIKLFILKIVPQVEYSTASITTYGLKVALTF